jgi:hypothetical protein
MTTKEKAEELFYKYCELCADSSYPEAMAKKCTLISVNQIIQSNPHSNPLNTTPYSTMDYWFEVKEEIEKL